MEQEDKYVARTERMISRWAGKRLTYERKATPEGSIMQHERPQVGELNDIEGVYIEKPRALPILERCDVLVVGAGPAGTQIFRADTIPFFNFCNLRNLFALTLRL